MGRMEAKWVWHVKKKIRYLLYEVIYRRKNNIERKEGKGSLEVVNS